MGSFLFFFFLMQKAWCQGPGELTYWTLFIRKYKGCDGRFSTWVIRQTAPFGITFHQDGRNLISVSFWPGPSPSVPWDLPKFGVTSVKIFRGRGVEGNERGGGLTRLVPRSSAHARGGRRRWPSSHMALNHFSHRLPQSHAVFLSDQPLKVWCPLPFQSWQSFDCFQATLWKGKGDFVLSRLPPTPSASLDSVP